MTLLTKLSTISVPFTSKIDVPSGPGFLAIPYAVPTPAPYTINMHSITPKSNKYATDLRITHYDLWYN